MTRRSLGIRFCVSLGPVVWLFVTAPASTALAQQAADPPESTENPALPAKIDTSNLIPPEHLDEFVNRLSEVLGEDMAKALTGQAAPTKEDAAPSPSTPSQPSRQDKAPADAPPNRPEAPPVTTRGALGDRATIAQSPTGLLDLHVRNTDIATVLEWLSYEAQINIVTSTSVSGPISANLYEVTLEEALRAILTPNHYAYWVSGNTVFVGNPEEIEQMRPAAPPAEPETRVIRLRYLRASEAEKAAMAVLTPNASVVKSEDVAEEAEELGIAGGDYIILTDLPDRLDKAEQLLAELDQRPRQVLIEATVLRATLNENNQFGIDFTMLGGVDFQQVGSQSNASADLTTGATPPNQFQETTFNINTDFTGNITGGGFTFGLINNNIATFLRALEDFTDVVVVANPKIVALNKQEAQVIVGRRDGYLTTTVTETAAIQTVQFLETGTQIKFRPIINDDNTVRLSVHPKDSNGGLTAANLPFEETTEAHADLFVDDGHTVLIGGLFRERTVNSQSQLPVLGNIPVAGLLFGSFNDQTIREEVIILLTVHVLKNTESEREYHRSIRDDVERIRVGIRSGLVGTGRERFAQACYREALENVANGKHDQALFNARLALFNQPRLLPAIKLREQLLDRRVWDDDGARIRTFVMELIERESTHGAPQQTRPLGRPVPAYPASEKGDSQP